MKFIFAVFEALKLLGSSIYENYIKFVTHRPLLDDLSTYISIVKHTQSNSFDRVDINIFPILYFPDNLS